MRTEKVVNERLEIGDSPEKFCDVFELFERERARYVVVSGVAVVLHGYKRPVLDLDIVIDPAPPEAQRTLSALTLAGFVPSIPLPIQLVTVLRMFDRSSREVDVFVRYSIPFEQLWMDAKLVKIAGHTVRIASFEHLMQLKQFNGRPHDLQDIDGLMKAKADELMPACSINPYISFIENRLFPDFVQHAVFHRLTNEIIEPSERVRSVLIAIKLGNRISLSEDDLTSLGEDGIQLRQLIEKEFLISEGYDPLTVVLEQYVARPIQNPALAYHSKTGEWILVRTSMEHTVYSRKRDELPPIIEEKLSSLIAGIFLMADGTRTLEQIFTSIRGADDASILQDTEFKTAIDFLTSQERQLIKFTAQPHDLDDPFKPVNIVPRNLYHSDRWDRQRADSSKKTIIDFHLEGIEDARWEFDLIEPTMNHSFRFPHEALGGLDYGSRFCLSTLRPEVVPLINHSERLEVLEVGGGTGSFALSFIKQAATLSAPGSNGVEVNYHILDLSPTLMENQRTILSEVLPESSHFQQDATEFDLPGHTFDLIISNEVIADFPVASVERNTGNGLPSGSDRKWRGDGAYYLEKYDLADKDAPDSFVVNAGAFRFIERAWKHLNPGGTLIVSEYGSEQFYPTQCYHLNHEEFSIHFGHVAACASRVGFQCRLLTLKEFLGFDDEVLVLNGREEHLLCLNHVLKSYGQVFSYAVISKSDFERRCQVIVEDTGLIGYSFSPLKMGYHFGPNLNDFLVLIMNKPL